ncbi:TH1 protein [Radiomyces spectabilis]|uniref:TH1 protein n=1 Tax=Radiomyces spectabilis TaxID=64574 RepID=UPI00221FB350|nr:TH1 protein [Radiomyces spectabilis]KAI8371711.1 TH1 protein [Radiomyces spectabilis]
MLRQRSSRVTDFLDFFQCVSFERFFQISHRTHKIMSEQLKTEKLRELSQPDAILEQNIYVDALSEYLRLGGTPMDAVSALSESYIGLPSMCNITAQAANSIGLQSQTIMRDAIREMLKERFDPKRCDALFMNSENQVAPEWLDTIIQDPHWRQTIYELIEQYPRCSFLNFAVLRIVEAGYSDEIANLKTASTYIKIYNIILGDTLSKLVQQDDLTFDEQLPDLVRICCEREETYLYAQILIQKIRENYQGLPLMRLSKELEKAAIRRGQNAFVEILRVYTMNAPLQLSGSLKAIHGTRQVTPGDIMTLYKLYTSPNPPPAHFICDFDLIYILLKAVYIPNSGPILKPDIVEKTIFLIAYAVCVKDASPSEHQNAEVSRVSNILKELHKALKDDNTKGANFTGAMSTILSAIRLPIASMVILLWIEHIAIHTQYFETYFRTSETPIPHLLLDEIAHRHPLQQSFVFETIKNCLSHQYQNFAPEIHMALQKSWIDRLLYLVQLHYTKPVMNFMKGVGRELDDSLIVHFVNKVLRMAQPPYSIEFVEDMVDVITPIVDVLNLMKPVQQAIDQFFDEASTSSEPMNEGLEAKIDFIRRKNKQKTSMK